MYINASSNGVTLDGKVFPLEKKRRALLVEMFCLPSEKEIYSKKEKKNLPLVSKFFPVRVEPFSEGTSAANHFRLDPFQKGILVPESKPSHKSCLPCKTWQKLGQM